MEELEKSSVSRTHEACPVCCRTWARLWTYGVSDKEAQHNNNSKYSTSHCVSTSGDTTRVSQVKSEIAKCDTPQTISGLAHPGHISRNS